MMEPYYYVIKNWDYRQPKTLLDVGSNVSEKMEGNKNFLNPPTPVSDLILKMQRTQTAYNNRDNGKLAKTELKDASKDMDSTLRVLGIYVTNESKGVLSVLQTSGFEASKGKGSKSVIPGMPTNVKLKSKNNYVTMSAKKPAGTATMCWVIYYGEATALATVEDNMVKIPAGVEARIIGAGKASQRLSSLPTGTKVTVQVMAQNAAGCSALSEPVTVFVNK
jgi:hypothetical protein